MTKSILMTLAVLSLSITGAAAYEHAHHHYGERLREHFAPMAMPHRLVPMVEQRRHYREEHHRPMFVVPGRY